MKIIKFLTSISYIIEILHLNQKAGEFVEGKSSFFVRNIMKSVKSFDNSYNRQKLALGSCFSNLYEKPGFENLDQLFGGLSYELAGSKARISFEQSLSQTNFYSPSSYQHNTDDLGFERGLDSFIGGQNLYVKQSGDFSQ